MIPIEKVNIKNDDINDNQAIARLLIMSLLIDQLTNMDKAYTGVRFEDDTAYIYVGWLDMGVFEIKLEAAQIAVGTDIKHYEQESEGAPPLYRCNICKESSNSHICANGCGFDDTMELIEESENVDG